MPQVPYQPYPTTQPRVSGEELRVQAPSAAFGENIGAALSHLGTTFDQVGGELFQRAVALKQLDNETEARTAAAAYAEQQAKLQADYDATVGMEAKNGLTPHLEASRQLRDSTRAGLSNPAAQKMFDGMTFGFLERNIFSSSRHAGDAKRALDADGFMAEADLERRKIESSPDNPKVFTDSKAAYIEAVKNYTKVKKGVFDDDDPIVQDAVAKANDSVLGAKISGISNTRPVEAMQMLQDAKKNKEIGEDEYNRLESLIVSRGTATATANVVSDELAKHLQADGTYDVTEKVMQENVKAAAEKLFPNFPHVADTAVRELSFRMNSAMAAARRDHLQASLALDTFITKHPMITTAQEVLNHPEAKSILEKMGEYDKGTIDGHIHHVRGKQFGEEWAINDHILKGLRQTNPTLYAAQDLDDTAKWNLKPEVREDHKTEQIKVLDKPDTNPKVTSAMAQLWRQYHTELNAMGVRRADATNEKSNYNRFMGVLQEALMEWPGDHNGKMPGPQDIAGDVWERVKGTYTQSHWWRSDTQEPAYRQWVAPSIGETPQWYIDTQTARALKAGLPEPTRQQLWRAYRRELFDKIMKTGKGPEGPPGEKPEAATLVPHGQ